MLVLSLLRIPVENRANSHRDSIMYKRFVTTHQLKNSPVKIFTLNIN